MPLLIPTHRPPTHPGEMMREEFLTPRGVSRKAFAAAIGLSYGRVNKILNGKGAVTAAVAYRFAKYSGIDPEFWLEGQMAWDMYHAQRSEAAALERIQPLVWEDYPDPEELADGDGASEAAEVAAD